VPLVARCYFVLIPRSGQLSACELEMNKEDLGFTATMFGWGAAFLLLLYFFFEVRAIWPLESLERAVDRRIMVFVVTGPVSAAMD